MSTKPDRAARFVPLVASTIALLAAPSGAAAQAGGEAASDAPPSPIYDKPYVRRFGRGAAIGGYMDHEFIMSEAGASFDQHRFIPFFYSAVTEALHVSAEIEFEHGGFVAGDEDTDGEIKIEYAVTDLSLANGLNLRGGVILSPLGRFNLLHDSPLNDLTDRPLVDRDIIPTTLSESGLGFYGTLYPNERWTLSYEAYAVNGFNEGILVDAADAASVDLRVREGRGSAKSDNNNHRSLVARINASPRLGTDFGVSVHTGAYDDAGDHDLTVLAFDGEVRRGPIEVLGEYAWASAEVPAGAQAFAATAARPDGTPRAIAESQRGFTTQANVHFAGGAWKRFPDSIWTGAVRYDLVDFDADIAGDDARRLTVGVNFRPIEDAAFKWDVAWGWQRAETATDWGDSQRTGSFSIATYF